VPCFYGGAAFGIVFIERIEMTEETGGYFWGGYSFDFINNYKKSILKQAAKMNRPPYEEYMNCILWHKDRWQQRHNWLYRLL